MLLGCIADDFTGATDLANMLVGGGMRCMQTIGVPQGPAPDADAVVVALKSRTIAPQEAVEQSLAALTWLRVNGCRQFYFKYCSTFDSTPQGNIGPVIDALMQALGTPFTIACPAFPENGRTIFRGYLYVGDLLLSESGMKDHPLTPMRDANLVRVLQPQTRRKVGLARYDSVARGTAALRERFAQLQREGCAIAIVDAVSNADLHTIGAACADMPLVTAGSGVALGLPDNFRKSGQLAHTGEAARLPHIDGYAGIVSGSCSVATNAQVAEWRKTRPAFRLEPRKLVVAGGETAGAVVNRLGIKALRIGPQIDPGVPWTLSTGDPAIALALKSGNFGATDFFAKALEMLA